MTAVAKSTPGISYVVSLTSTPSSFASSTETPGEVSSVFTVTRSGTSSPLRSPTSVDWLPSGPAHQSSPATLYAGCLPNVPSPFPNSTDTSLLSILVTMSTAPSPS